MADSGRKDFSQKISEKITPQSEKSMYDKTKESVTDTADKIANELTPDNQKSFSQSVGDSVQKGHDDAVADADVNAKTWGDSAHDYMESSKKAVADAAEYVTGAVTGAKEGAESYIKKH